LPRLRAELGSVVLAWTERFAANDLLHEGGIRAAIGAKG
jgi:hypothetical protein